MITSNFKSKKILRSKRGVDFPSSTMLYLVLISLAFIFLLGTGAKMYMSWVEDKKVDERCRATLIANSVLRYPSDYKTMEGMEQERFAADCVRGADVTIKYSKVKSNSGTKEAIKFNIMKEIALEGVSCDYRYMGDIHERVPFNNEPGMYCGICNDIKMDDAIQKEFPLKVTGDDTNKLKDFYTYIINNRNPRSGNYFSEDLYGFAKPDNTKPNFDRLMAARIKQFYSCSKDTDPESCKKIEALTEDQIAAKLKNFDQDIDPTHTYNWVHVIRKDDKAMQKIQSNIGKQTSAKYKVIACGAILAGVVTTAVFTAGTSLAIVGGVVVGTGEIAFCGSSVKDLIFGQASLSGLSEYQPNTMIYTVLVDQKDFPSMGCDHVYGLSKESVKPKK